MVYSLLYRRPAHVNSAASSVYDEKRKSVDGDTLASEGSGYTPFGIPDALSFDKIISGGTCPVSLNPQVFLQCYLKATLEIGYFGDLTFYLISTNSYDSPAQCETS